MSPHVEETGRVEINYRAINAITKPNAYPMPRMDDLMDCTATGYIKSLIDLNNGYWQIKVRDEDAEKKTLLCRFRTFLFLRMPFESGMVGPRSRCHGHDPDHDP